MSDISSQENDNSLVEESASFRQPVDDSEITERYRFFFFSNCSASQICSSCYCFV